MTKLRLAIFGCGFWAHYQIAAWRERDDVEIVAVYNRTRQKAVAIAESFAIPAVYDDAQELLHKEQIDAVDIITDVGTHASLVRLVAEHSLPVICQKPMATSLEEAQEIVEFCHTHQVPFFVHENWRWQRPIRQVKQVLESGVIGQPFRARIQFSSSFPLFDNQPALRELEQFILTDIGSHILDVARFLFGEAQLLYCRTTQINPGIKGEDVATVMLQQGPVTCTCEMSYASRLEHERFPETYLLVEGSLGSLELGPDYWVRTTTAEGTLSRRYPPRHYAWADPAYDLAHASIVDCNAHLLQALRGEIQAETSAQDNLKTVQLVFHSYASMASQQALTI